MKYNSVENAAQFFRDQIAWCIMNGYKDFTIWSNGNELRGCIDTVNDKKPIEEVFRNGELKTLGFWKALIFRNGHQVEL